jgi:hypothetical protein
MTLCVELGAAHKKIEVGPNGPKIETSQLLKWLQVFDSREISGAPGETRTPDPLLRRQTLYPAELRAPRFCNCIIE